jgi:hypothetical protein
MDRDLERAAEELDSKDLDLVSGGRAGQSGGAAATTVGTGKLVTEDCGKTPTPPAPGVPIPYPNI